ncbi:hypothetical protein RRG08_011180 [Elysia crispata]|uniref:Uncharacterized protein n=1 Tax=Elysia crispata TaxID=231223 RepID=A0AAE1D8M6_9GAST|nr:hypothetical protein RRG08_011180 [Elysia crispata]
MVFCNSFRFEDAEKLHKQYVKHLKLKRQRQEPREMGRQTRRLRQHSQVTEGLPAFISLCLVKAEFNQLQSAIKWDYINEFYIEKILDH